MLKLYPLEFIWATMTLESFGLRSWELEPLYSVEEAARILGGLSKYTIEAWLSKGKLRRTKVGRRTMIRESELQRVIEDGGKSPGRREV